METPAPRAALLGGSGHARSVADVLRRLGIGVELVIAPESTGGWAHTITDDRAGLAHARSLGLRVVLAVGDNELRAGLAELARESGLTLPPLVATSATRADDTTLGDGSVVLEHAHVGPRAHIGDSVVVNTAAVVEHDVRVGAASHIAPGAVLGGEAAVGAGVLVGTGAVVLPGVAIGDWATVGAGATVIRDVPAGARVVGVPAHQLRTSGR